MTSRTAKLWAWMTLKRVTAQQASTATGISLSAVYRFINGRMSSTTLRAWFVAKGCPKGHLRQAKTPVAKKNPNIGKAA